METCRVNDPKRATDITLACLVLHNFVERANGTPGKRREPTDVNDVTVDQTWNTRHQSGRAVTAVAKIRDAYCRYVCDFCAAWRNTRAAQTSVHRYTATETDW